MINLNELTENLQDMTTSDLKTLAKTISMILKKRNNDRVMASLNKKIKKGKAKETNTKTNQAVIKNVNPSAGRWFKTITGLNGDVIEGEDIIVTECKPGMLVWEGITNDKGRTSLYLYQVDDDYKLESILCNYTWNDTVSRKEFIKKIKNII